jgi:transformation/transcription domain-associated protein
MVMSHQNKLPRDLLQTGLRPILMNLADPKRLSVSGLEGLARLLELLTNYFKVEIGSKLLDHFRFVADPQMLQASSKLPLHDNEGINKLVRITNIFHLLPSTANMYLESLVNAIVQIEAQMQFSGPSPFTTPLAKYLNRYPVDSMDFFMNHILFPRHIRSLRSVLETKLAPRLLREVVARASAVVTACFQTMDHKHVVPGLLLIDDITSQDETLLMSNQFLVDGLIRLWRTHIPARMEHDLEAVLDASQRANLLISIFIKALKQAPRIDLIFEITTIFTHNLPIETLSLARFIYQHVASSNDLFYKRSILLRFFSWFSDPSITWVRKTYFIRYIISPMLLVHATTSDNKGGLIDEEIVKMLHSRIWAPMNIKDSFPEQDDALKVELLHLTSIMVQYYSQFLVEVQKVIIKSTWNYITSEDVVVKYTAYLLAARFFESFPTPEKFVVRAWTGLLRPPHNEGRALVRQALDVLAVTLPRMQSNDGGCPQWAKTTRRLLAEEGAGISQILIIYQLIVRQRDLFYPVRSVFVPHMVNSLFKLGLGGSNTHDSRLLSVEVVQVMFEWEQKATGADDAMAVDEPAGSHWEMPINFKETMVSYLVKLATTPLEVHSKNLVIPRALTLLRSVLGPSGWNDVTVKLHFFVRALEQVRILPPPPLHCRTLICVVVRLRS